MSEQGNIPPGPVRSRPPRLRIVVTGGIGAGKSTVSALFEAAGAVVIEADRIGHEVLRRDHPVAFEVAHRWPHVVGESGDIDRTSLAAVVFDDPAELARLERITHPAIATELAGRAEAAGDVPVVVEVPIIRPWFDESWWWVAVTADPSIRLDRAAARGVEQSDVERRMASQPDDTDYAAAADFVVVNDGSLSDLADRIAEIWKTLHSS